MCKDSGSNPAVKPTLEGGGNKKTRNGFDDLMRLFELYTHVQVDADTIYYQRTSVITLTEGLLLLAFQGMITSEKAVPALLVGTLASVGLVLSILWLFFEQRNEVYFKGRGSVLLKLEEELSRASEAEGREFSAFWTVVPAWVKENARWYQRLSAPLVLRGFVPSLFVVTWLGLCLMLFFGFGGGKLGQ